MIVRKNSRGAAEVRLNSVAADETVLRVEQLLLGCVGCTDAFDKSYLREQWMSADTFSLHHAAAQVATKYQGRKLPGMNPREKALNTWRSCEAKCEEINQTRPWLQPVNSGVFALLCKAREKIASILGSVPRIEELRLDHGKGATFTVRRDVSGFKKNLEVPSGTIEAMKAISRANDLQAWRHEHGNLIRLVDGSALSFVPKTCKTDRPICIEPTLNSMYQRAIGRIMKARLLRAGCNLRNQGANRAMVYRCIDEGLCTVDFTSASDTISYEVVKWLLPWKWLELLLTFRSDHYLYEGTWHEFAKFSSMGNGYTFELESLIFFAIALAVAEAEGCHSSRVSVYGDDVILPRACFNAFQRCVTLMGLEISADKSFTSGLFFESCGVDVYCGQDITPFRFKKPLRTYLDVFKSLNAVTRWIKRNPSIVRKGVGLVIYELLLKLIPPRFRFFGPEGYGDNWIVTSSWSPTKTSWDYALQRARHRVRGLIEVPIRRFPRSCTMAHALYLCETWSEDSPKFSEGYPLRGRTVVKPKLLDVDCVERRLGSNPTT